MYISRKFIATFTVIILYEVLITLFVKIFVSSKVILQRDKEPTLEESYSNKFYIKWLILELCLYYLFIFLLFRLISVHSNIMN